MINKQTKLRLEVLKLESKEEEEEEEKGFLL